jgi:hypothetical protein
MFTGYRINEKYLRMTMFDIVEKTDRCLIADRVIAFTCDKREISRFYKRTFNCIKGV